MKTTPKAKATRNYNYTISVWPRQSSSEYIFRDIYGSDLEFLDRFFGSTEKLEPEDVLCICQRLLVNNILLRKAWRKDIYILWNVLKEEILVNYTDKLTFLRLVCGIQHGRYVGLMEDVPMSKLITMVSIYQKYHEESGQN